jgi:tRNA A37 N6-isopentenylltransferase MiaA
VTAVNFSGNDNRNRRSYNSELTTAPHHFIQNKSIFENYTVGEFEKEAKKNR